MATRKISFESGKYFHIYNRGNSKQVIFQDNSDYTRFVKLLFLSNGSNAFKIDYVGKDIFKFERGDNLVSIGTYCLMPNHFHVLLTQKQNGGISKFILKLQTGYSMYFNRKYDRTGSLYEGTFKSQSVDNDRHLKYLFSYIHLNPLKIIDPKWREDGIKNRNRSVAYIDNYPFSSYQDYIGSNRKESVILAKEEFPRYFQSTDSFKDEVFDWLNYSQ
ncbi:MAG: hypothetical protein A2941_02605 [Candidatus Yanofskybacteria bacterium RIFCSPLOWO2_01_FULL_49_17]|uniref:Transposase IS200-like domain-containing protein n=1 Tax=Candidatus Yanofskybacteria bacterium RIFCSPLOWO2_01_FULL_49_17 TaxID=1802700 RepID=A0A1F8GQU1_9BACT|nr:MAG: hypothetical protein A2941_02605 [Candidatus Yanofskybacteria bacterium RIFCSPLOWO2_01_FULL_49_17]